MKKVVKVALVLMLALLLVALLVSCEEALSVVDASIDENGDLILTMSDGTTQNKGKIKNEENSQGLRFFLLPDGTYSVAAGDACFLKEVVIPATYKGKAVTCIGFPKDFALSGNPSTEQAGFFGNSNLEKIVIPDSVKHIGAASFQNCVNLKTVEVGANSQLTQIDMYAFEHCTGLESISLPSKVQVIGDSAFEDCRSLSAIQLPSGLTSLGKDVFDGCAALKQTEGGVSYVGKWAVSVSNTVTSFTLRSTTVGIANGAFSSRTNDHVSIYIPIAVRYIGSDAFSGKGTISFAVESGNEYYYSQNNGLYEKGTDKLIHSGSAPASGGSTLIPEDNNDRDDVASDDF